MTTPFPTAKANLHSDFRPKIRRSFLRMGSLGHPSTFVLWLLLVLFGGPFATSAEPVKSPARWFESVRCLEEYKQADLEVLQGGPEGSIQNPGNLHCEVKMLPAVVDHFQVHLTVIGKRGRTPLETRIFFPSRKPGDELKSDDTLAAANRRPSEGWFLIPASVVANHAAPQKPPHVTEALVLEFRAVAYDDEGKQMHSETRKIKGVFAWFE